MVLNAVNVSFLIIYLNKLSEKCWFAFKNQHLKKKKTKEKRQKQTSKQINKKERKKEKPKEKISTWARPVTRCTVERLMCFLRICSLCVYSNRPGGSYVCSWGQKRNHKFCRKEFVLGPCSICFASHIVQKRDIFVKGKELCIWDKK